MKTDNYLTLCLEQAAKSPLHYRHGCIIVRGGKVIGQGYNDYRPGFNGGALKHGRIANGALDGAAITDLKEKLKEQKKEKLKKKQQQSNQPDDSQRFKSAGLKLPHLNQVLHHHGYNNSKSKEYKENPDKDEDLNAQAQQLARRLKETSLAFHEQMGGEKHHHQNQNEKKGKKIQKEEYRYQYEYQYGQQIQQHTQNQPSASERSSLTVIRGYDSTTVCDVNELTTELPASPQNGKHMKDYKRSGKMRRVNTIEPPQPESVLLPKGKAGESASSTNDRKKHPRLNGADIYVTRLGWCKSRTSTARPEITTAATAAAKAEPTTTANEDNLLSTSASYLPSTAPSSSSGSLHDELLNREPSPGPSNIHTASTSLDLRCVRASRPCYRCISYMHSVGIKRVFWTNDAGEWEGGKVRDLVGALDNSMDSVAAGGQGGPMGNGVFVTKHEVLMLKRMMGAGGT